MPTTHVKVDGDNLVVNMAFIYDGMSVEDKLRFIDAVAMDERLVEYVCAAVGSGFVDGSWFPDRVRDECLLKLRPIMEESVAKSLTAAVEKANANEEQAAALRSVIQCRLMATPGTPYYDERRYEQFTHEWEKALSLFPDLLEEFGKIQATPVQTPAPPIDYFAEDCRIANAQAKIIREQT